VRRRLIDVHTHRYGMLVQYKPKNLMYYAAGQTQTLPEQALHNEYFIFPDGSPDAWNPLARLQKFSAFLQMCAGTPQIAANINWEVLAERLLRLFDGRLALQAFIPTGLKGATEYESAVLEISSMIVPGGNKPSFPPPVRPEQDHQTRVKACLDWMHAAGIKGTPVDKQSQQNLFSYINQHMMMLKQQNPNAWSQMAQMVAQVESAKMPGGQPGQPQQPQLAQPAPQAQLGAPQ
jgi:hypothetical protein